MKRRRTDQATTRIGLAGCGARTLNNRSVVFTSVRPSVRRRRRLDAGDQTVPKGPPFSRRALRHKQCPAPRPIRRGSGPSTATGYVITIRTLNYGATA
ncbi:hypothetical protein EVAR_16694_1 [Eumeta japonica]|uniref:Uncharacterized protein n=1 Tax=Eumeta variegata TaxID=151549 RepID=A0A4C1V4C4_EUMVA|nr:hypothetical protein EVAR_16694_1 [Eumeta japonica]